MVDKHKVYASFSLWVISILLNSIPIIYKCAEWYIGELIGYGTIEEMIASSFDFYFGATTISFISLVELSLLNKDKKNWLIIINIIFNILLAMTCSLSYFKQEFFKKFFYTSSDTSCRAIVVIVVIVLIMIVLNVLNSILLNWTANQHNQKIESYSSGISKGKVF